MNYTNILEYQLTQIDRHFFFKTVKIGIIHLAVSSMCYTQEGRGQVQLLVRDRVVFNNCCW